MPVALTWKRRDFTRLIVYGLVPILLFAQSCGRKIGKRSGPCAVDPDFAGRWDNQPQTPRLILNIGYLESEDCTPEPGTAEPHKYAILEGSGANTGADSPWQRVAFTGSVTALGEASVTISLWAGSPGPDDPALITVSDVTLSLRNNNTLSFPLIYSLEGEIRQEFYELTKQ